MIKQNLIKNIMAVFVGALLIATMVGCGNSVNESKALADTAESVKTAENIEEEPIEEEVVIEEPVEEENVEEEPAVEKNVEEEPATEISYQELYREAVEKFQTERKDTETENCKLYYDLIYFDDDDIPELVMGRSSYYVYMYTVIDGEMVAIIDNWPYGAFGNEGYEYLEKQGVVFNSNSDMAGAEIYLSYLKWNPNTKELEDINDDLLFMRFYRDVNGDGIYGFDDLDACKDIQDPLYFYGEDEITEEEFNSHTVPGEYKYIHGDMAYEDIMSKLQ